MFVFYHKHTLPVQEKLCKRINYRTLEEALFTYSGYMVRVALHTQNNNWYMVRVALHTQNNNW